MEQKAWTNAWTKNISNKGSKKIFFVVEFKELPFHKIDNHVCVPHGWITYRQQNEQKAFVAYPHDEAPSITRSRVKKREKLDEEWRYYLAVIKYESDTYQGADDWIMMRTDREPVGEKKPEDQISQAELVGRQLRSSRSVLWLDSEAKKNQLSVKPQRPSKYQHLRPLPLRPWKEIPDTEVLKPNETAGSGVPLSSEGLEPGNMEQVKLVIKENRLIQNEQTQSVVKINGESCSGHSTQPELSKEDQLVDTSVQFTTPEIADERQSSSVRQDCKQPLSSPTAGDDEPDVDVGADKDVQPDAYTEERASSKNLMGTPEQASQPHLLHQRPSPLVHHHNSLPKLLAHEIPTGQSKANGVQHPRVLITSTTVLRPPTRANLSQQYEYEHVPSPLVPVSSTPTLKPQLQTDGRNSANVTYSHQKSSTSHTQAPLDLSSQRHKPTTKRKSLPITKKLVEKKARLESITKNMPAIQQPPNSIMQLNLPSGEATLRAAPHTQNHAPQAFPMSYPRSNVGENVDQRLLHGTVATTALQNFSNLAHQSRSFGEPPKQQCFNTNDQYFQYAARMQELVRQRNVQQSIDQKTYLQPAVMNEGHVLLRQPNQIYQPTQFLPPHEHQHIPTSVNYRYMQELIRHEMLKTSVDEAYIHALGAQPVVHNPSFVPSQPQNRQNLPNFRDPRSVQISLPVASKSNGGILKPQEVTTEERAPAVTETSNQPLPNGLRQYSLYDPRKLAKLSRSSIYYYEICAPTASENTEVQTESTIHDSEAQTRMSFNQVQGEINDDGNPAEAMDSQCHNDEYFMEEQESPHQEEAPGPDVSNVSDYEDTSDDQDSSDDSLVDTKRETQVLEKCASPAAIAERQAIVPSPALEKPQEFLKKMRQELLDLGDEGYRVTMLVRDMYHVLDNFMLKMGKYYNKLADNFEKSKSEIDKDTSTEFVKISAPEAPQVAKKTPVKAPEQQDSSNCGRKKKSSVSAAPSGNHKRRYTFVLPPEYDPKDSRWTLKHRENGPELTELVRESRIYVNKKELKKVIEASNDCRTLARLLVTSVFSKNALSVCSLTGGKARAFKPLDIDVRPGLDKYARLTLLEFIEEYGNKRRWNTADTLGIISSIRTKIQEMRTKFGKKIIV